MARIRKTTEYQKAGSLSYTGDTQMRFIMPALEITFFRLRI